MKGYSIAYSRLNCKISLSKSFSIALALLWFTMLVGTSQADTTLSPNTNNAENTMTLTLTSPAFAHNDMMPIQFTCDNQDLSPALAWSGIPEGTKSLVLIVDDPDAPDPAAPKMTWVHWVLYNIPPQVAGLAEAITPAQLPTGTLEGINDWKRTGYGGPCPPIGVHRYFHKLYALDTVLPDLNQPTKAQLEQAMQGHIIGQVELIGRYKRNQ